VGPRYMIHIVRGCSSGVREERGVVPLMQIWEWSSSYMLPPIRVLVSL
jgi:hypothetical protein